MDSKVSLKIMAPRLMIKALATLDKSTAVVVAVCWGVALVTLIAALISVHSAVSAKQQAADATIAEPVLPVATTTKMTPQEEQVIVDRLAHQFPDIKFEISGTGGLVVRASDGSKFHQWITALSYIDTMAPKYRWALHDMCVGHCAGADLMHAEVTGQKVVFTMPPAAH